MSVNTTDKYRAAAQDQKPLKNSFDPVGANPAQAPEDSLDPVVAAARRFLQGFANLGTPEGARNTLYDAGYSGNVSSIILGSSAPNYDTGMGGSAGKQDEKKKQDEWDRLFRLQLQLAQRLQEIDWEIEKVDKKIHDTKEHMTALDREKAELEELRGIYDDHLSGRQRLEVGADGKLKNEKAEKALQEFERRTGKKVDRNNREELEAAVRSIKWETSRRLEEIEQDRKQCEDKLKQYGDERNKWETERIETREHKDQVDKEFNKVDEAVKNTKEALKTGDKQQISRAESAEANVQHLKNEDVDFGASESEKKSDASIDLSTSAASRIDQDGTSASMRGSFKTAHGALQVPHDAQDTELSRQDKAPAIKSPV